MQHILHIKSTWKKGWGVGVGKKPQCSRISFFFPSSSLSPTKFSLKSFITIKCDMVICQVWQIGERIRAYTQYNNNVLMVIIAGNEASSWHFNVCYHCYSYWLGSKQCLRETDPSSRSCWRQEISIVQKVLLVGNTGVIISDLAGVW